MGKMVSIAGYSLLEDTDMPNGAGLWVVFEDFSGRIPKGFNLHTMLEQMYAAGDVIEEAVIQQSPLLLSWRAVPLALLGMVAALMIRHMESNIYTQIGIVLLIALASKNAIPIVEFAVEARKRDCLFMTQLGAVHWD